MALPNDTSATVATGMFDGFPIARTTSVGVSNGFWTGGYGGNDSQVCYLTNAQLYDNSGTAVGAVQLVVNIAMAHITYVV